MTRRLLVVDDEVLIARALRRVLAPEWEVVASTRGLDALARFRDGERFDAILLDIVLPDLDGRELYRRITLLDPLQASSVIFITGTTADETVHEFLRTTATGWLTKPFSIPTLRDELTRLAPTRPSP